MSRWAEFERRGFVVFRNFLEASLLAQAARWCDDAIESVPSRHLTLFRSQGSCVDISNHPDFADLIGHVGLSRLFDALDLGGQVFCSGSVIRKPPQSPALFWHQDWWGWGNGISHAPRAPQVNVLIYLDATSVANGCLRVIPGSHRLQHRLHDQLGADPLELSAVLDSDHVLYRHCPDECAVDVRPGDIVLKDARLLHGTYANGSDANRTLISLNFNPCYAGLPLSVRVTVREIFARRSMEDRFGIPARLRIPDWPTEKFARLAHLVPDCPDGGPAEPLNFQARPASRHAHSDRADEGRV